MFLCFITLKEMIQIGVEGRVLPGDRTVHVPCPGLISANNMEAQSGYLFVTVITSVLFLCYFIIVVF